MVPWEGLCCAALTVIVRKVLLDFRSALDLFLLIRLAVAPVRLLQAVYEAVCRVVLLQGLLVVPIAPNAGA